jgi:radical SAM protein with 4Fe4S-binding SPASM domain
MILEANTWRIITPINMENSKRANEQSLIFNRNKMEECPPDVNSNEWDEFRAKYNLATQLNRIDTPAQIDIELNSHCNLRCTFCIQSAEIIKKVTLDFNNYKAVIDQCRALNIRSLKLNYQNEPLLNKEIFEYIKYAKDNGFINIFFASNGILLTEEIIKGLIDSGLTKIFISLDAFKDETYKKLRGKDELGRIKNNILLFLKIRNERGLKYPLIRVNFLKTNENILELDEFISFWINKVDLINVQDMNELINNTTDLFIEKTELYKCSMPFKQLVITASGDILPCCTMHGIKHKIGHINNMSLEEAWQSDKINYLRTIHENGDINKDPICKACIYGK